MSHHNAPKKIVALLLALTAAFVLCSCTPSEKVKNSVSKYLSEKYGALEFELIDFSQNKSTNGWCVVNMHCADTDVNFKMFVSTVRITDGYGVARANKQMKEMLLEGPFSSYADNVKSLDWLDEFEDGYENYSFREVDPNIEFSISSITNIDSVELEKFESLESVATAIYDMVKSLEEYCVYLKNIEITFEVDAREYVMNASYIGIMRYEKDKFIEKVCADGDVASETNIMATVVLDFTK